MLTKEITRRYLFVVSYSCSPSASVDHNDCHGEVRYQHSSSLPETRKAFKLLEQLPVKIKELIAEID